MILSALAREQAVLKVSHNPGAATSTRTLNITVAEVDSLDIAGTSIITTGFGVTIVETATSIIGGPIKDGKDTL